MSGSAAPIPWRHLLHTIRKYMPLWAGATILFTGLGYGYTGVRKSKFSASQSLLVRNEANGEEDRLGKFASQTDLKAAQETILELVRSRDVVYSALKKLGPNPAAEPAETPTDQAWPSVQDVEDTKSLINLRPPKGSEFGATEVIYLETKGGSKKRAFDLCLHVRNSLTESLRNLRADRSTSVIDELSQTVNLAKQRRDEARESLQIMESEVGSDLGELRALTETYSGSGNSQRVLADVEKDLQRAGIELDKLLELEKVLQGGQDDPDQLIVTGGELLASQPTLKRLKDGFIDAQLRASQLSSLYTPDHPKMKAAEASLRDILIKIRQEITASINSMAPQIRVATDKVERLKTKQTQLGERMTELADMRVKYSNLVADFKHRADLLEKAEGTLAEAEATRQSAISTDLLTPLGPIQVGDKPLGPNNLTLVVGSIVAGLLCGFGMVFLVAPGPNADNFGRRWSDYSGQNLTPTSAANVPAPESSGATDAQAPQKISTPETNEAQDAWVNLKALTGEISKEEAEAKLNERRRNPRS